MRIATRFSRLLFTECLPLIALGTLLFAAIVQLIELFSKLPDYLNLGTGLGQILYQQLLYLPKSIHLAIPVGLLYGVSYAFGILRTRNELLAVHASGVSLGRFVLPLLLFAAVLGPGLFLFEDALVIPALQQKEDREALGFQTTNSTSAADQVQRLDSSGRILYSARRFDTRNARLLSPLVLVRDDAGRIIKRIQADSAEWLEEQERWQFLEASIYDFLPGGEVSWSESPTYSDARFTKLPEDFWVQSGSIEQMQVGEAWRWIRATENSGLPVDSLKTRLYERYAFIATPLIVVLLSIPLGSRIKKNIILFSLLASLAVAVVFYVLSMLAGLLATLGLLDPAIGAWIGPSFFLLVATILLVFVRN